MGDSLLAQLELFGAAAGEDEVGVAIDETGVTSFPFMSCQEAA